MKDKILNALKTKFTNLGFSDKAFAGAAEFLAATVTDEANIETAVAGVEPLLKAFQGEIDYRVGNAVAKTKSELEKKPVTPPAPPTPPTPTTPPVDPNDIATLVANAVKSAVDPLRQKIDGYEKREKEAALVTMLKKRIGDKVPEAYLKNRPLVVESEQDIERVATEIENDYTSFKQELINSNLFQEVPRSPVPAGKEGEAQAKTIAEKRNAGKSDGVEGKPI